MNFNEQIKIFKRASARNGMFGSYWLINHLPYPVVKVILHVFISIGFFLTIRLKQVARESLHTAFGNEKSDREINEIVKQCFANLGQGMVEMIYFNEHPHMIKDHVIFEGLEHLENALKQGKGVIAITAHFGNFPLMMMTMARQGYKVSVMMRKTRDPQIDAFLFEKRTGAGLKTIYTMPRKQAISETIRALRNNEIVFILMDQNFGSEGGVYVDFFGKKAATAPGPIVMAHRTGAQVVPIFIRRERDDINKVVVEPPMLLEERPDYEEMIYVNVVKATKIIEGYIRRYPHEWGWMHRRWKSEAPPAAETMSAAAREEIHGDRQEDQGQ